MKVYFSDRAYTAVLAETLCKIETETGGVFLGKYIDGDFYIVESIDPGPNSIFREDYFEYDQKYVQHLINKKALLYKNRLDLIGLWHRHPGSFDSFSRTDDGTNSQYAAMRKEGAISMLVNIDPSFRLSLYHVSSPCHYSKLANYAVGDELFPAGLLSYKDTKALLKKINGESEEKKDSMAGDDYITDSESEYKKDFSSVLNMILPSLRKEYSYEPKIDIMGRFSKDYSSSKEIAEEIASDLYYISQRYGIAFYPTTLSDKIVVSQGSGNNKVTLSFTYSKKERSYIVKYINEEFYYHRGLFERILKEEIQNGI